ncbi:MAG: Clp protease N-terminal domain-containing protein [Planctomycetota bacterium]|jgi:ATP-dependent Clp protease ATP-binding subunit ClpC
MFERYTENARRVLSQARQQAQKFHHDHIGTEHILLGLIKIKDGVAADILEHRNIDLKHAKSEVKKMVLQDNQNSGDTFVALPRTTHAHELIDDAVEEARALKHNYIGTEHLLLALLHEKEGRGAKVLGNLGLKLDEVRQDVIGFVDRAKNTVSGGIQE